jgi:hypothetical protein
MCARFNHDSIRIFRATYDSRVGSGKHPVFNIANHTMHIVSQRSNDGLILPGFNCVV